MMTILFYALLTILSLEWLRRQSTYLMLLMVLPSTILHESAHWLSAFCLGARPKFPSFFPKRVSETEWQLGSVSFVSHPLTAGVIALAPLWLQGGLTSYIAVHYWQSVVSWEYGVLLGYAAYGSLPSRTDWKVALSNPLGTVLVLCVLWYVVSSWIA